MVCPFCHEALPEAAAEIGNAVGECERCASKFTSGKVLDKAQARLREALETERPEFAPVLDGAQMWLFAWNPDEILVPSVVARILDLHPTDIPRRAAWGRFPGATKDEAARNGHGVWRIPRSAVWKFIHEPHKSQAGGPRPATSPTDRRLKPDTAKHWTAKTKKLAAK